MKVVIASDFSDSGLKKRVKEHVISLCGEAVDVEPRKMIRLLL